MILSWSKSGDIKQWLDTEIKEGQLRILGLSVIVSHLNEVRHWETLTEMNLRMKLNLLFVETLSKSFNYCWLLSFLVNFFIRLVILNLDSDLHRFTRGEVFTILDLSCVEIYHS